MNIYRIQLELAKAHAYPSALDRVLESLGTAVTECRSAVESAEASGFPGYVDAVVDEECAVIEDLIGAALVACQAALTGVVSYLIRLHENAKGNGVVLITTDGKKGSILACGSPSVAPSSYSQVQVIDAFANYFKHRDEWHGSWASLTGQARRTIDIIVAVGAQQQTSGNLRVGAKALGITPYEHLTKLSDMVSLWTSSVVAKYEAECQGHKLV